MEATNPGIQEIAFYYPGAYWASASWIKNLLLFFDGIGLLVPTYMKDRIEKIEPEMVGPFDGSETDSHHRAGNRCRQSSH